MPLAASESQPAVEIVSLIADIGGTNARFATADRAGRIRHAQTLAVDDFPDPASAARSYLEAQGLHMPRQACFAVACPTDADEIRLTNNGWIFSVRGTREQLGVERLEIINDFTALSLSLPYLESEDLQQVGGGAPAMSSPIGVIGPGTGLGVTGLVPTKPQPGAGDWVPIGTEGGHVSLAVSGPRETAVLHQLESRFGRVSAERVLSGPGLVHLYEALAAIEGGTVSDLSPSQITARAMSGESPLCRETLAIFCAVLGSVAGDLALTLGARGGIYIGGGIVPKLGKVFTESDFRRRFEDKGRMSPYVAAIPVYIITAAYPGLTGAAAYLERNPRG